MDYKTAIIEMLDKLENERYLRFLYQLLKTLTADN